MYKKDLSVAEANTLCILVEEIVINPRLKGTYSFSDLKGYTRLDVIHAFMLKVASIHKDRSKTKVSDGSLDSLVSHLTNLTVAIAYRGMPEEDLIEIQKQNNILAIVRKNTEWSLMESDDSKLPQNEELNTKRLYFAQLQSIHTFHEYCRTRANTGFKDYWREVYDNLGLEYNESSEIEIDEGLSRLFKILLFVVVVVVVVVVFLVVYSFYA